MGNSSSSSKPFWPPKLFKRQSKNKNSKKKKNSKPRRVNSAPPVGPMYDTVAEIPVYSVVDKSRKRDVRVEDDVQYAEVEVVRRPQNKSQKKPPGPQQSETEYATINFNPENDHTRRNAPVNQYSSPLYFNPQENHTRKISPADKSRPAHRSRGQSKSTGKYNSVNGTLV